MALLERVSTLLRANLNDLLDKAEDPEKLSKQILLDMENQLLQVKTQVAVAVADQHRLVQQKKEQEEAQEQWRRKAELAVSKGQDDMARSALERSLSHERLALGFGRQYTDQAAEAETLRGAYGKLEAKLAETRASVAMLLTQHRRNQAAIKAQVPDTVRSAGEVTARMARLVTTVRDGDAAAQRGRAIASVVQEETLEERFQTMEQTDRIEALLLELKEAQPRLGS